jgi:hypothetical protein
MIAKKCLFALLLILVSLTGCSSLQVQSPVTTAPKIEGYNPYIGLDVAKQVVDGLCPTPRVPDARGDFLSGFLDRFNKNRINVELSTQQVEDYTYLKSVCVKPVETRTDYDYGWLAGGTAAELYQRLQPFFGRDLYNIASMLGIAIR